MARRSAADESARYRLEEEQAQFVAMTAAEMHDRYLAALGTDKRLGALLGPLEGQGFTVLADRQWPGSTRQTVDYVIVGPTGVTIVDAQSWSDVHVVDGRVFQGQEEVTHRFEKVRELGNYVEASLAEIGLAPGEVRVVAVFLGQTHLRGRAAGVDLVGEDGALDYVMRRGSRLRPSELRSVLDAAEQLFAPIAPGGRPVELALPDAAAGASDDPISLVTLEQIEATLNAGVLARPVETWMAFLAPDQARLARRSFNGPSRIRGAAGTGKTVVALHRAAWIARNSQGRVLVTSFVRTLPAVLASQMNQLAPELGSRVEFADVHSFAHDLLRARGIPVNLDPAAADTIFDAVWAKDGKNGVLGRIDPRKDYWKEEVVGVIKGRGLALQDEYLTLARVGRRRALTTEGRAAVWQLHLAYDSALHDAGVNDDADVILMAEDSLHDAPLHGYSAIVVDEAQDLSAAMVRMLHAVVGDTADGLTLVGDGQQTIYPGGYTLAEVGVSIAGRGVVMSKNYRNTMEIADFAASLVVGDQFMDIEGSQSAADITSEVVRHGAKPRVSRFSSREVHDDAFMREVRSLLGAGVSGGEIGILTQTPFAAVDVLGTLLGAGIPAIDLLDFDGHASSAVKVGTIKRAKGLEFKHVLVVRTPAALLEASSGQLESAIAERRELDRRELYVAMTRARDGLWVGVA